jgi:hypothetical protein
MSDSRPLLQFGPVLAATVVIAGLGIVLPLYLAYEARRDAPAEIDVSADENDSENSASVEARTFASRTTANAEAAVTDPFDDPAAEPIASELDRAPIRRLNSETDDPDEEASADFDSGRTSWEAPYDPSYWKGTGWKFDSTGMRSDSEESTATFRRAYTRFMFECRIEPLEADPSGPLCVRLKGPQANTVMTLTIDGDRLTVTDESRKPADVIKEETVSPSTSEGQPTRLKLAATGNRLIVSWNGTVALTCNQIAGQSGRPIQFEFTAPGTAWLIRDLRIEGE